MDAVVMQVPYQRRGELQKIRQLNKAFLLYRKAFLVAALKDIKV